MTQKFEEIEREDLVGPPTPLQEMPRLKTALESLGAPCPNLYVKREDLTRTAGGGNKVRKLEYLLADARAAGADTVVTAGAVQSNHVRQTAGAAARLGFNMVGLLFETVPNDTAEYAVSGNVLLDGLFGADIRRFPGTADGREVFEEVMGELSKAGRKTYLIPLGGSSAVGCLGYVRAMKEITEQCGERGISCDHVIVANGSMGTHAGLAAGAAMFSHDTQVHGISVLNPDTEKVKKDVHELAEATLMRVTDPQTDVAPVILHDAFMGDGYGIPTSEMAAAVRLAARTEGLLLDPVYSGKAMAGLVGLVASGAFKGNENVVFVATGGSPGLFAYAKTFNETFAEAD